MNHILEEINCHSWEQAPTSELQLKAVSALEQGKIIFLPQLKFDLTADEMKFLNPQYVDAKTKNISFDTRNHSLKGAQATPDDKALLQKMMDRFSKSALSLVLNLMPHYQSALEIARTSFRPAEISGRPSSYRKDDTRLHVDAFPASPNQGRRILRIFTNVNPDNKARIWRAGEPFAAVAERFLPQLPKPFPGSARVLNLFGLTRGYRTLYDHYMLHLHDAMKEDLDYQKNANQTEIHFPTQSSWIVYTDCVSHAAMAGQHVFEQTFHLPVQAMQQPALSPLRILERLLTKNLT